MGKVYIVTAGSYSDYHICAVFETEELANGYVASFAHGKGIHEMQVEEYPINAASHGNGLAAYFVRVWRNGHISEVYARSTDYGFEMGQGSSEIITCFDGSRELVVYCFAKDEAHAVKIASEKHTESIANGQWD